MSEQPLALDGARDTALRALGDYLRESAPRVSYRSRGRLLIIAPAGPLPAELTGLDARLDVTVARSGGGADLPAGTRSVDCQVAAVSGHLGAYRALDSQGESVSHRAGLSAEGFDLVLDYSLPGLLQRQWDPPGYYAVARRPQRLREALEELPELVGEFEKPKYFVYESDLCAHGARGLSGCTRCLSACPADAIVSAGDHIEVDPNLCQGGGSCTAVCPSGALRYALPPVETLLGAVRRMLHAYRQAAEGEAPAILFHDRGRGSEIVASLRARLPTTVLPVVVEEVGSVGMDTWLSALAYGAQRVDLLLSEQTPGRVRDSLARQLAATHPILTALGYDAHGRIRLVDGEQACAQPARDAIEIMPAEFEGFDDKRLNLRFALEHLLGFAVDPPDEVELPSGAPFGTVLLDQQACTLCMACVAVCPPHALLDGGDRPALQFIESQCVQCGLCEQACPEDAITPTPRMLLDVDGRLRRRLLYEQAPFCCVSCAKPFATRSVIELLLERLATHPMYQNEAALRRLQMCEDCRVRDLFSDDFAASRGGR